jgi:hypothetical protein
MWHRVEAYAASWAGMGRPGTLLVVDECLRVTDGQTQQGALTGWGGSQ